MILFIDTTNFEQLTYATVGEKVLKKTYKLDAHRSHGMLGFLEKFLHQSKISNHKSKISKIVTCKGPGSYTGTRIGVTHALALGFAWNVPVKFLEKTKFDGELQKQINSKKT